jgi:hypothetical protein
MSLKSVTKSDSLLKYSIARKQEYLRDIKYAMSLKSVTRSDSLLKYYIARKQEYLSDIKYSITSSSAPWEKKDEIMNVLGITAFTKLKIMEVELKKKRANGLPRIRLAIDYYKLFSNFDTIKGEVILLNGNFDISSAYHSFICETKNALKNLIVDKKQIDRIITHQECKDKVRLIKKMRGCKKKFLEVYNTYRSVYLEFIDNEVKSICPTVALNEDVVWLIAEYL